ncbi:MAG: TerC/Alx family metal homeostasis membrane protein [Ignavibacteriales bacterium]|nr:TerC/Alx family metal homeostasis membrane protein [Ignavibacteriales bacterium]
MHNHFIFWVIFSVIIIVMFYIDLSVTAHRKGKISIKSSLIWSGVWIGTALLFNLLILLFLENGKQKAIEFLAGYLVEKSLSLDNLFVFLMIFNVMGIKDENQPHVLKWGIISAIAMRILFILAGIALINMFHPIIYFFGALLLYAAYHMAFGEETQIDLENNRLVKFVSKAFRILPKYEGRKFFLTQEGKLFFTPLFLTLILVEAADVIFNLDSVPAVIAITTDSFIVITSNIFAILGLRALYFALAGIVDLFVYLKYGVSVILTFVGLKMLVADYVVISTALSLGIIILCIAVSVILSLMKKKHVS